MAHWLVWLKERIMPKVEKMLDKSGLDCEDTLEKEEHLL